MTAPTITPTLLLLWLELSNKELDTECMFWPVIPINEFPVEVQVELEVDVVELSAVVLPVEVEVIPIELDVEAVVLAVVIPVELLIEVVFSTWKYFVTDWVQEYWFVTVSPHYNFPLYLLEEHH